MMMGVREEKRNCCEEVGGLRKMSVAYGII